MQTKTIPLTQGKFVVVDADDYGWLSQWKWRAMFTEGKWYAIRDEKDTEDKREFILMHRLIMETPKRLKTDHVDGDGLNNCRHNLRNCSNSQNMHNRGRPKNNTTGYKGVNFYKRTKRYRATIQVEGTGKHLGYFNTAKEAAMAFDKAAKELVPEFANLNFP